MIHSSAYKAPPNKEVAYNKSCRHSVHITLNITAATDRDVVCQHCVADRPYTAIQKLQEWYRVFPSLDFVVCLPIKYQKIVGEKSKGIFQMSCFVQPTVLTPKEIRLKCYTTEKSSSPKVIILEKLEPKNLWHFCLTNGSNYKLIVKIFYPHSGWEYYDEYWINQWQTWSHCWGRHLTREETWNETRVEQQTFWSVKHRCYWQYKLLELRLCYCYWFHFCFSCQDKSKCPL